MKRAIDQIKAEKECLEANIQMEIGKLIEEFRSRTGISPYRINVEMVESDTLNGEVDQYFVGNVTTFIEI